MEADEKNTGRKVIRRSTDGDSVVYEPVPMVVLSQRFSEANTEKIRRELANESTSLLATSGDLLYLLENPLDVAADHFLFHEEEEEEHAEKNMGTEEFLGNVLYESDSENTANPAADHLAGSSLSRSVNSPNIFYWKGALSTLSFSTDGLFRIVSGPHVSSSDFSELFAGIVLSSLYGRVGLVGIDKTLPRAMRTAGSQASGVPDLYCVQKEGAGRKFIVSVKRYFIFDDRISRKGMAHAILRKAFRGLEEYLSIVPLPGDPIVVVLASDSDDAHLINQIFQEFFSEKPFKIFVIVIAERGDVYRLVFRYTIEDVETIKEIFAGRENKDFVKLPDVPWLQQEHWFQNPQEEEDFEYDDLAKVFGSQFCGGGDTADPSTLKK